MKAPYWIATCVDCGRLIAKTGLEAAQGVTLEQFDATQWGFLRLTVTTGAIAGEYVGVDREGNVTPSVDTFTVPVGV